MGFFSKKKPASASAKATVSPSDGAASAATNVKPDYYDTLDPETQKMLDASRSHHEEAKPQTFKEFLVRSPFRLGFIVTLGGLLAIVFGQAVASLSTILIYIVAAMFIALGLDPVVRWLGRKGVSRGLSITIVFSTLSLLVVGILLWIIPQLVNQITEFIKTAPQFFEGITNEQWFINANNTIGSVVDLDGLVNTLYQFALKPENWATLVGGLWQAGIGIANGVTAFIIIFILSLYFLASLQTIKRAFYQLAPKSNRFRVIDITEQVTQSIGGYISGMVTLAAMSAVIGFIVMSIVGVPFVGILTLLVFGLGLIPLIGPLLGWSVVTIVSLFDSPVTALTIGIFALIYMQIEAYVLTPRVMNKAVSVPGSLVVIGAMAGGTLLGLLGALIAIPVAAMILIIIKQVWMPQQEKR